MSYNDESKLCNKCYTIQLEIIRNVEPASEDSMLSTLLQSISEIAPVEKESNSIDHALLEVTSLVGHFLLNRVGILLPEAYREFLNAALRHADNATDIEEIKAMLPKRCFLNRLLNFFGEHIKFECKIRSIGVLIYRQGADILTVLSKTLHAFRRKGLSLFDKCINMKNVDEKPENEIDEVDDVHVSIRNVCTVMNTKIRQQAKSIMQMQCTEPLDMTTFNRNNMISKIDPALFKMVVLLTQRLREYRQDANTILANLTQKRKTQCLYCLCVLIFATDSNCSAPMHILLADAIEANGGSKELIKIMNRVGAVASNDTLQRHIESVSIYRLQKGLTHELNLNALAIVSVDNIDFLQSYAFVYSGDVSRSWHGTTIQVVQPSPPFVINNTNTHIYIPNDNDPMETKITQ